MLYNATNANIKTAGQLFLNGEIVVYPTDTLYGMGVDATNTASVLSLNKFKDREMPLSIIVSSIAMLKRYANVDKNTLEKIKKLLPGRFTVLLDNNSNNNLSSKITLNTGKVGVRIPKSEFIISVVTYIDRPIVTTSVNRHGKNSINDIDEIVKKFNSLYIFKDNKVIKSKGSTILDLTKNETKLIRKGDGIF